MKDLSKDTFTFVVNHNNYRHVEILSGTRCEDASKCSVILSVHHGGNVRAADLLDQVVHMRLKSCDINPKPRDESVFLKLYTLCTVINTAHKSYKLFKNTHETLPVR